MMERGLIYLFCQTLAAEVQRPHGAFLFRNPRDGIMKQGLDHDQG